jgi:hypothetical protein
MRSSLQLSRDNIYVRQLSKPIMPDTNFTTLTNMTQNPTGSVYKSSGGSSWTNALAITDEITFQSGSQMTATNFDLSNANNMFGIGTTVAGTASTFYFAIWPETGNTAYVGIAGTLTSYPITWTSSTVFKIIHTGTAIEFYGDSTLLFTYTTTSSTTGHYKVSSKNEMDAADAIACTDSESTPPSSGGTYLPPPPIVVHF